MDFASPFKSLTAYIGAHATVARTEHERDRASQRTFGCLAVMLVILVDQFSGGSTDSLGRILLALTSAYLAITVAYRFFLKAGRGEGIVAFYAFLVLDPLMLILVLYCNRAISPS